MCVIMLANKVRPTEEMVERAWAANKDGAGIAWREGEKGKEEIVFEKGIMNLDAIKKLCAEVPKPYVVHFRVASVGGVKPTLTHPFIVSGDSPLDLNGRIAGKGALLFHNGHWAQWHEKALDVAIHSNSAVPEGGDWSDSRAIAWMTYIYGPAFMDLLPTQKGVLMTKEKFNVFTGGTGWEKINDVWCSNDLFWLRRPYSRPTSGFHHYCNVGRCNNSPQHGKDICFKCEEEARKKAEGTTASSVGQSRLVTNPTENTAPFVKTFTVAEVEAFHKAEKISKNMSKKYRKLHSNSLQKGNRGIRAQKALQELLVEIYRRVATVGSTH